MNSYQISTKPSYKLIVTEAKNNVAAVSLIPTFAKGINRLEEITNEMDSLGVQQAKDLTGITKDKHSVLEELTDYTVDVAGAVHSYAVSKNDKTLQEKVNFKVTRVTNMNQQELMDAAAITLEEARKISAETLAEEGITAEELTEFTDLYNTFKNTASGKREAEIDRSGHTDRLAELFAEAADLKKNTLDRLATQFQRKAPEFYLKYKAAATIIHKRSAKKTETTPEETK
jgi:hypothetical protein